MNVYPSIHLDEQEYKKIRQIYCSSFKNIKFRFFIRNNSIIHHVRITLDPTQSIRMQTASVKYKIAVKNFDTNRTMKFGIVCLRPGCSSLVLLDPFLPNLDF